MSLISFGGGMLRGLSGQAVQSKCSQNVDERNLVELCEFEIVLTLRQANIGIENGTFENVFPIEHVDIPC